MKLITKIILAISIFCLTLGVTTSAWCDPTEDDWNDLLEQVILPSIKSKKATKCFSDSKSTPSTEKEEEKKFFMSFLTDDPAKRPPDNPLKNLGDPVITHVNQI